MLSCKRCLIRETDESTLYERIKRTIEAIPEEQKCNTELYEKRLEICRECDKLLSGMCRVCGCFVEVRAARTKERCPAPGEKMW